MLIKKISLENVRSFLDRAELVFSNNISIVVGPNGGGKTNFLDTLVIVLRRFIFRAVYVAPSTRPDGTEVFDFRENDALNQMQIPKHNQGETLPQLVRIALEITATDVENMRIMKAEAARLTDLSRKNYTNFPLDRTANWDLEQLFAGTIHEFVVENGNLIPPTELTTQHYLGNL